MMGLIEYIKGGRHGKDAHRIEKESMRDPFLYDAIDGFDSVKGAHGERIADIHNRISRRSRQNNHRATYLSIAASLIVLISIGAYFIFSEKPNDFIAKNENLQEQTDRTQTSAVSGTDEGEFVTEEAVDDGVLRQEIPTINNDAEIIEQEEVLISEGAEVIDEIMLARTEQVEEHVVTVGDSGYIADATQNITEENVAAKQGLNTPAPSSTGLSQSAASRQTGKPARLETPEPKIGWRSYRRYLRDSLRRPTTGDCVKAKGTVEVTFHIDEKGSPYDFVIGKSLCSDADDEAIRLVKEGSLWTCESYMRMKVEVKF